MGTMNKMRENTGVVLTWLPPLPTRCPGASQSIVLFYTLLRFFRKDPLYGRGRTISRLFSTLDVIRK